MFRIRGALVRIATRACAVALLVGIGAQRLPAQAWYAVLAPEVNGATGSGFARFWIDINTKALTIDASWSGLSGTTTIAHIHCCVPTPGVGTVAVAVTPGTLPGFPEGVTAGSYLPASIDLTSSASYTAAFRSNFGGGTPGGSLAALTTGMNAGTAYFNIHSTAFPGGEIRGFIQVVPEPSSVLLMAAGLAGVGVLVRRRRA